MTLMRKPRIRFMLTVAVTALSASAGLAQEEGGLSVPDNMLTRSLDNMPRAQGAEMANDIAGQNVFDTEEKPEAQDGEAVEEAVTFDEEDVGRDYKENADPITQNAIRLLDESGVIGRQRAMAESIIIMDQQLRFNAKLEELLVALGPDAEIEIAPGEFRSFEQTPAGIRAQIEIIKLQQELAEIASEYASATDKEEKEDKQDADGSAGVDVATAAPERPEETAALPSRDDGTGFQSMQDELDRLTAEPEEAPNAADRIAALLEEAEQRLADQEAKILRNVVQTGDTIAIRNANQPQAAPAAPAVDVAASEISLREIYGAAGVFAAIVDAGGERREVRLGDEVAGYVVSRIGRDHIEVTKDGSSTRISF